jgi:hypothetical protein
VIGVVVGVGFGVSAAGVLASGLMLSYAWSFGEKRARQTLWALGAFTLTATACALIGAVEAW